MSLLENHEKTPNLQPHESGVGVNPFEFELGSYVYEDRVGNSGVEIVNDELLAVEDTDHIVGTTTILVTDPYVNGNPEAYELVKEYVNSMEREIEHASIDVLAERQKVHPYNGFDPRRGTPFTSEWVKSSRVEALKNWRNKIPHASALGYLTLREILKGSISNREGLGAIITAETAMQLRYVDDAVGIRDRSAALRDLTLRHLSGREVAPDTNATWLSLACGTAEPSILAAKAYMDSTQRPKVDMHLLDYDKYALEMVHGVATREGYDGKITLHEGDLLNSEYPSLIRRVSGLEVFDIVENMGFEEYLPSEGDTMGAFKKLDEALPQASDFTKNAWDLVAPGGMLISGNMILDRPQIGFVFGVVGWPIINARTEQEVLRVYERAGILDDPSAKLTMHRVRNKDTGVCIYNVVTVEKTA